MLKRLSNRLALMTLVPILAVCIVLCVIASLEVKGNMEEAEFDQLKSVTKSIKDMLHVTTDETIVLNEDETLSLGGTNLNEHIEVFDELKEERNVDVTLFYGDTRRLTTIKDKTSGDRLVGTQATDAVIETVLKGGKDMTSDTVVINDVPYFVYYAPMQDADGKTIGMYFAGKPKAAVEKSIKSVIVKMVVIAIIFTIVCAVIAIMIGNGIANAVKYASSEVQKIASGDLSALNDPAYANKIQNRGDEIGAVMDATISLRDRFEDIVGKIKQAASQLEDTSVELAKSCESAYMMTNDVSTAVDEVANGATNQAASTMEAQNQTVVLSGAVTTISDNVTELYNNVENMIDSSKVVNSNMDELLKSNEETLVAVEKINEQESITAESVRSIQKAADMITDIASQTNLLSLNASIEAARAGEAGRGFAVVASEISGLAEQSNASAKEISVIIEQLLRESATSLEVAKNLKEVAEVQGSKISETKDAIDVLSSGIDQTGKSSSAIEGQISEILGARDSIVDQVDSLSAISEENAASAQETTASTVELNQMLQVLNADSEELSSIATELNNEIAFFH